MRMVRCSYILCLLLSLVLPAGAERPMGRLGHLAATTQEIYSPGSQSCRKAERDLQRGAVNDDDGFRRVTEPFLAQCLRDLGFQYYEIPRFSEMNASGKCRAEVLGNSHRHPSHCFEMAREGTSNILAVEKNGSFTSFRCWGIRVENEEFWRRCFGIPGMPRSEVPSPRLLRKKDTIYFAAFKDKDHKGAPSMSSLEVARDKADKADGACENIYKAWSQNGEIHPTWASGNIAKCFGESSGYKVHKFAGQSFKTTKIELPLCATVNSFDIPDPQSCLLLPAKASEPYNNIAHVVLVGAAKNQQYTMKCFVYQFVGKSMSDFWARCQKTSRKPSEKVYGSSLDTAYINLFYEDP